MLTENVIEVEKHVQAACDRAGRSRDEVTLIAVSKTKPVSDIEEVLTTGILDYGENKVQELSDKYEVLPKNIRWHMIGHLLCRLQVFEVHIPIPDWQSCPDSFRRFTETGRAD